MFDRCPHFPGTLVHGFTDRDGGVSQWGYRSLNLGGKWGDDPECVAENLRRVAAKGGFELGQLRRARQVHGARVAHVDELGADDAADAVWCRVEDRTVVAVLTADCVPILIVDEAQRIAAAVHSGWRGTVADIAGETVRCLMRAGGRGLSAAIGPCIELDAFEVGDEVADAFDSAYVRRRVGERPHVDLVAAVKAQLERAGVERVHRVGGCTLTHPERWFSYRRDGASGGQQMSFVGFP